MDETWDHQERRRYVRIEKHFIISYYIKDDPVNRHEISQLKNISMGGMCFVAAHPYAPAAKVGIELKTPFLAETAHLEGAILESREKVPGIIYETRVEFDELNDIAALVLTKIVETFLRLSSEQHYAE